MYGLRGIFLGLVMYFRSGAEAFLPMMRPIVVLHRHLFGSFCIPAHGHAVDQTAHERQKTEYEEYDAQHPENVVKEKPMRYWAG